MSTERSSYYPKTVHILFAVVLATSFPLAATAMIPIDVFFELSNAASNIALALSYVVVILGWVGYARSISVWRYKDTGWGFMRFVVDTVILFEYFYLLQVAHRHIDHTPYVLLVLAGTYLVSDMAKYFDQPRRKRQQVKRRTRHTVGLFITTTGVILIYFLSELAVEAIVANTAPHQMGAGADTTPITLVATFFCVVMAVRHRYAKWKLREGVDKRSKRRGTKSGIVHKHDAQMRVGRLILAWWLSALLGLGVVGVFVTSGSLDIIWTPHIFAGAFGAASVLTVLTVRRRRRQP